ncbi:hypothetical protein PFDG_00187 [Plasmodium falciparum Dd2]|uniref:Erythrocyte membrane protein 1 n=2 Tax=Plasmodium falciparum TaxID=5833 RepID=A0A0L7LW44_PLAF4|nr:hypothetical protein PFDG_00187 [Plasmodium falciparum Dd2]
MGKSYSKEEPKIVVPNVTYNSPRNVLENIGKWIKDKRQIESKHERQLKGTLSSARFIDILSRFSKDVRQHYYGSCSLDHKFHTNMNDGTNDGRSPCHNRNQNRFDENAEAYCNNDKIRDNGERSAGGACAPFRRQNLCDKNLEYLINENTNTTHDLLGNVLVTAKYEGASIVEKHPNRGSSEVCTALARSFADIGDIIRGRDMFKRNDKDAVRHGLKVVFKNIYDKLSPEVREHYKDVDGSGNYYKLREDWWKVNRDQVWKALTCNAPKDAHYFLKSSPDFKSFSDHKCGHDENAPLTNLDYVPQFLRWFDEWSEEFCRIKKIKIDKTKEECRGGNNKKECSKEGYDCNKTNLRLNEIFVDLQCPNCEKSCTSYSEWIENKKKEFKKQKKKYEMQLNGTESHGNMVNESYDKTFYNELKNTNKHDNFFKLFNKGQICENVHEKNKIDHNYLEKTFSSSEYCKSCPIFNLKCANGKCNSLDDIKCPKIQTATNIRTYKIEKPIDIHILVNDSEKKELSDDLKDDFKECDLFKRLRKQNWNCKYKCNLHVCELQNFNKEIDDEKHMLIEVLIKRWLKYFLKDYNKIKEILNECINNGTNTLCIEGCYKNCECVEKWIKEKREEWQNIKARYVQQYESKVEDVSSKLKKFLKQDLFTNYIKNALDPGETLDTMKESSGCNKPSISNRESCKNNDVITILLNRLQKEMNSCKTQHKESNNQNCLKTLPPPLPRRPRGVLRLRRFRRHRRRRRRPPPPPAPRQSVARSEDHNENTTPRPAPPAEKDGAHDDEGEEDEDEDEETTVDVEEEETPKEAEAEKTVEVQVVPAPPPTQDDVNVCSIVEKILTGKKETDEIVQCNRKYKYGKGNYPPWDCNSQIHRTHNGACMPPRRQKLCVINLQYFNGTSKNDLRKAFIECAAVETFFLWNKYKEDKKNEKITYGTGQKTPDEEAEIQLKSGIIPDDFKRQMFYTFGDFRDFLFGTDISKNHGNGSALENQINSVFPPNSGGKHPNGKTRQEWWNENGPYIWKGMLCALSYNAKEKKFKVHVRNTLTKQYGYSNVKFSDKTNTTLSTFSQTPQFLRWFTEWSDEFCTERKKLEDKVGTACKSDYEGCANTKDNGNGNCVNACNKYKEYISGKQTQYESQEGKFEAEKTSGKAGYENYSGKKASDYLKNECLNSACNCMDKVHTISNYWEKPHKTYDTLSLQKKCSCPPPPCEIVDAILGDKSSKGYVEGCRKKYKTPRSQWECGKSSGEGGEDGDKCIPPRRKRLYVKDLQDLTEEKSPLDLREAFIKCAAVETFFAWHEFKKEKEREEKEQQYLVGYISADPNDPQKQLEHGNIPDEFKRQMFYTFGDYRDIFFGKDIGSDNDMETIKNNIDNFFPNKDKIPNGLTREKWWKNYGPDIWEGMLCALSYDTETKEFKKEVSKNLTSSEKTKYLYNNVTFGDTSNTKLIDFVKRPSFFRWLQEWGEQFYRKRIHKLAKIKVDCRAQNGQNHCDDDGFDCDEIGPNEDKTFETFKCPSCAISCRSYKEWINTKKNEFNKHEKKYQMEINNVASRIFDNYDKEYVQSLSKRYASVESFLDKLKEEPYYKENNEVITIDFKNIDDTFGPAKNCAPCPTLGVNCKESDCNDAPVKSCNGKNFIVVDDIKKVKKRIDEDVIIVSDNSTNGLPSALMNSCQNTGMFEGIKENEWSCGYICDLDICKPKNIKGDIDHNQYIPIRILFKRWVENFLKDYNKTNDKISHCMNYDEKFNCINGCKDKCNCVQKWIGQKKKEWEKVRDRYLKPYEIEDSKKYYSVRTFLETLEPQTEVRKAIKPFKNLIDLEDSNKCIDTMTPNKNECENNDVITILLHKLQERIKSCQSQHKPLNGKICYEETYIPKKNPDINTPSDNTDTLALESYPPPFCNVPANPCGKPDATNVVSVKEVAKEMHEEAQKNMVERSGKDGEGKSCLVGDITLAKFKSSAKLSEVNKVCDITKEHSYANGASNNPCHGKGDRLKIETQWKDTGKSGKHVDVYLPPRREHMCTSNLEYLLKGNSHQIMKVGNNKINHSFLGEVLLAAKYEADYIKTKYKSLSGQDDKETICRAMKYSFADIGDIIRGKDLWEHNDFKKLEEHLVKIFGKIKEELKDKLNSKYDNDPDYKLLRYDWWEANRDQVWEAMKCPTKPPVTTNCDTTTVTPLVDYIPQRIRWMTEWAEWYCKMQKEEYEKLKRGCEGCRSKGKGCKHDDQNCKNCRKACDEYWTKIQTWEKQWAKIKTKYEQLYKKVQDGVTNTSSDGSKYETDVVSFLKQLHDKNSDHKIYSTAAGYIHQEAKYLDCTQQTQFCEKKKKNGDNPTNGEEKVDNEKYAFKYPPPDYVEACKCKDRPPQTEDGRARSDRGEDGVRPPVPVPQPAQEEGSTPKEEEETANGEELPPGPSATPVPELPGPRSPPAPAGENPRVIHSDEEDDDDDDDDDDDEDDDGEDDDDDDFEEEEEEDDLDDEEEKEDTAENHTEEESPQPAAPAPLPPPPPPLPPLKTALVTSTLAWSVGIGFAALTYFLLKKKPKSPVDLIRVLDIHKGDYGTPTSKSKNRYIPYRSGPYKGKTYIYMEGDSDSGHYYEDTTDITSSESEYEELDINDIYVPGSPKYKTLIEVVLEPSKSNGNTPSRGDGNTLGDDMVPTTNTFTDEEWNELKHDFISQYIQSRLPMDVPQYDVSTELPMNIVGNVLDDGINEKPFITSIHDRDLYTGEEIKYNINMSTNSMDDPKYVSNNVYSGIDLINDTLSGNQHIDIYDELLKRKENELFGTNHTKNTSNNSVAKNTNNDPIMNQLDLLHKWLDRHRDMCEKWNKKEELLDILNEQWNKDNNSGDIPSDSNKRLNTDVSIEIDMDETKGKKEFSNMDTNVDTPTMDNILDDLETYNEPFYDIYEDDVYYDVNDDENPSVDNIPMDHNKVDVPKKVHVEMKILNNTFNGSLEPEFPISDVWNI